MIEPRGLRWPEDVLALPGPTLVGAGSDSPLVPWLRQTPGSVLDGEVDWAVVADGDPVVTGRRIQGWVETRLYGSAAAAERMRRRVR